MAVDTRALVTDALKVVYADDILDWYLDANADLWKNVFSKAKNYGPAIGRDLTWKIPLQSPNNVSIPAEGAQIPVSKNAVYLQGAVRLSQHVVDFEISNVLAAIGQGGGAWKSILKEEMDTAMTDLTKNINRITASSHGTGRIGQVNATTSSATTFVGKLPFGTLLIRPRMLLDIRSAESSGTARLTANGTADLVSKVVSSTRTVTLGTAVSLTADDHIYLRGAYGSTPNGLLNLIDDTNDIHGHARSTYEELKSYVLGNSGTVRALTEDLLFQCVFGVSQQSGMTPDTAVSNEGMVIEWYQITRPDRRYNTPTAIGQAGAKEKPVFNYGPNTLTFEVCKDVRPRTIFGFPKSVLRRVGDDRPKWLPQFDGIPGLALDGDGDASGYALSQVHVAAMLTNVATMQPNACFRLDDVSDLLLCGAAVGGSDT